MPARAYRRIAFGLSEATPSRPERKPAAAAAAGVLGVHGQQVHVSDLLTVGAHEREAGDSILVRRHEAQVGAQVVAAQVLLGEALARLGLVVGVAGAGG